VLVYQKGAALQLFTSTTAVFGRAGRWIFSALLTLSLSTCTTDRISFNSVDQVVQYPYTNGHRWVKGKRAPEKGNSLTYALEAQRKLKALCGIDSRIIVVRLKQQEVTLRPDRSYRPSGERVYDSVPAKTIGSPIVPDHAILVYRASNGRIHLADNNHEFPVLARGHDELVWVNQMMPPFVKYEIVDRDYRATEPPLRHQEQRARNLNSPTK